MRNYISQLIQDLQKVIIKYSYAKRSHDVIHDAILDELISDITNISKHYQSTDEIGSYVISLASEFSDDENSDQILTVEETLESTLYEHLIYANFILPFTFKLTPKDLDTLAKRNSIKTDEADQVVAFPENINNFFNKHSTVLTRNIRLFLINMRRKENKQFETDVLKLLAAFVNHQFNVDDIKEDITKTEALKEQIMNSYQTTVNDVILRVQHILENKIQPTIQDIEIALNDPAIKNNLLNFFASNEYFLSISLDIEVNVKDPVVYILTQLLDNPRHILSYNYEPYLTNLKLGGLWHKMLELENNLPTLTGKLKCLGNIISKTLENKKAIDVMHTQELDLLNQNTLSADLLKIYGLIATKEIEYRFSSLNDIITSYETSEITKMFRMSIDETSPYYNALSTGHTQPSNDPNMGYQEATCIPYHETDAIIIHKTGLSIFASSACNLSNIKIATTEILCN